MKTPYRATVRAHPIGLLARGAGAAAQFREFGECSWDRREDKGESKLDEHVLAELDRTVRHAPQDHG